MSPHRRRGTAPLVGPHRFTYHLFFDAAEARLALGRKISATLRPVRSSIAASLSRKAHPSALASRRPMVDFLSRAARPARPSVPSQLSRQRRSRPVKASLLGGGPQVAADVTPGFGQRVATKFRQGARASTSATIVSTTTRGSGTAHTSERW